MAHLEIFFSENLHTFIRSKPSGRRIDYPLTRRASIKNIIESIGVPHTEIGAVLMDGDEIDFNFIPADTRTVHVYDIKAPFDVTIPTRLRPRPLDSIRFLVDVNVGKLANLLRMSGMDAAFSSQSTDKKISIMAEEDGRIVLSKDMQLLKRRQINFGRYIRSVYPDDQLTEVVHFFGLTGRFRPFSRCLRCNRKLIPVKKEAILYRLEPRTKKYFNRFNVCPGCNRIYWQGSHLDEMRKRLRNLAVNAGQVET